MAIEYSCIVLRLADRIKCFTVSKKNVEIERRNTDLMKILLYGVIADDNFGSPSLMHGGVEQLIHMIDEEAEIVYYQFEN